MKKDSAIVPAGNPEPKKSSLRERILALIIEKRITPSDPTHDVLLGEVEIVEELDRLLRSWTRSNAKNDYRYPGRRASQNSPIPDEAPGDCCETTGTFDRPIGCETSAT